MWTDRPESRSRSYSDYEQIRKEKWRRYLQTIRDAYAIFLPLLEAGNRLSPYEIGIEWNFTPIERNVWEEIRCLGLPLYPQVPVGPYFIDFADPKRKIAIEVDGRRWHQDKEKDRRRERDIEKFGWRIYRIPGWLTYRMRDESEGEEIDYDLRAFLEDVYAEHLPLKR